MIGYRLYMAVKRKKKATKVKKNTELGKQIAYLNRLKSYSLRSIDGRYPSLDDLFRNQANRIQKQIDKLQEKQ